MILLDNKNHDASSKDNFFTGITEDAEEHGEKNQKLVIFHTPKAKRYPSDRRDEPVRAET